MLRHALDVRATSELVRPVPRRMEWAAMALAMAAVALGFRAVEVLELAMVGGGRP